MKKYRLSLTRKLETEVTLKVFAATSGEAAEVANRAVSASGGEVRAAEIDLSEDVAAALLVKLDADFAEATISEIAPFGKAELADAYRFLLMRGYDFLGDNRLLKYENEAVFMKPLRDANQNGVNADLRVRAKRNRQTNNFEYFVEAYFYQAGDENDAAPAMLHLRDKLDGMTLNELTESLPRYEQKYRKIIFLVLAGAGKNYPPPERPTKYGEARKALKIIALQNAGSTGTGD